MIKPVHLAALIGINLIFSGAYIAGKAGVGHFPPLFFSAMRFLLVFLALLPFFRRPNIARGHRRHFWGFCLSMGLGVYGSMYLALAAADGVSGILIGTQFSVPMAALLSLWLLGDRITGAVWLGIVLAFIGVMIVGFDSAWVGEYLAFALILFSAFCYATANVISRRLSGAINVLNLNAWMALISTAPMFLLSLIFESGQWQALATADTTDWLVLLYSSLAVSLIGHVGMFTLLRRYPVSQIMPYYVLVPIFGVIGGILFFGETPTARFYLGAVIALSGVYIVNRRGKAD